MQKESANEVDGQASRDDAADQHSQPVPIFDFTAQNAHLDHHKSFYDSIRQGKQNIEDSNVRLPDCRTRATDK